MKNLTSSVSQDVLDFIAAKKKPAAQQRHGRLIFAIDATASRQPTWDLACSLQAKMFEEAAAIGGLEVQLVYYRGPSECRASSWVSDPGKLSGLMERVTCDAGHTQIRKALEHAAREAGITKIGALVLVGDCFEESLAAVTPAAEELARLGVPALCFHEGEDRTARRAFEIIANVTGGALAYFNASAPPELGRLLAAAAIFATGGLPALEDHTRKLKDPQVRLLTDQLRKR